MFLCFSIFFSSRLTSCFRTFTDVSEMFEKYFRKKYKDFRHTRETFQNCSSIINYSNFDVFSFLVKLGSSCLSSDSCFLVAVP